MNVKCGKGWLDGFVVDWFLAGGGIVRIVLGRLEFLVRVF